MASMLRDVRGGETQVNVDALKSEIRMALINQKANACPIAVRFAWHASGTFDKSDNTGGLNGATIRFPPESTDGANAGLSIIQNLLHDVKKQHPEVSHADLYGIAACAAIEFLGGPSVPFRFGRTDEVDGRKCPANGRLPDASQGAQHLRDVFGRMGMNDKEIVALSGAHTLGRAHKTRSGFDGPWTRKPLEFSNEYFINLIENTWVPKTMNREGQTQFVDQKTGELMMLPTDVALLSDPAFRPLVDHYAADEEAFFADFAQAYGKLLSQGCPAMCNPNAGRQGAAVEKRGEAEFREHAMHGSVDAATRVLTAHPNTNVNELEGTSGRSALHKAAFWGHTDMCSFLVEKCGLNADVQDYAGDTAMHDAARFGHAGICKTLIEKGASPNLKNAKGLTVRGVALEHGHQEVLDVLIGLGAKL